MAKEASTEARIKGYRVKVEYDAVSENVMKLKKESITEAVLVSIKKVNKDPSENHASISH